MEKVLASVKVGAGKLELRDFPMPQIDEESALAAQRESRGEIDCGSRFADAALLIGDGDDQNSLQAL